MPQIRISKKGDLTYIYDDRLIGLQEHCNARITRASHVEPSQSGWLADMGPSNGPVLGPFQTRKEALDSEVEWLSINVIGEKCQSKEMI